MLKTKNIKIQKDIEAELRHFQDDVVHLAAISSLTSQFSMPSTGAPTPIMYQTEISKTISDSNISEIGDFIDDLQDNLISYGMENEYSYDFALFLTSAILSKKQIIVCGSQAEKIGNSIALLIKKELSCQIFLPVGFTDISKLVTLINNSTSKVFVIHNALETFSDSVLISLSKCCKNKLLIFSIESRETYCHTPVYWSNYAAFIFIDLVWGMDNDDNFRSGNFDILNAVQLCKVEKNPILMQLKEQKLIKPVQLNSLLKLFNIYKSLNSNADMTSFPLLSNICSSISGAKESFFDAIENKVDENVVQMLKDEFLYE